MSFASDTAVRADGDGRFSSEIRPGWDIGGNANGGYLLATAARAMAQAAGRPDPVTITAHYLSPGRPGPATITTEVVKQGRAFSTVSGSLQAGDRRLLQVLGTFGDLSAPVATTELLDAAPPDLPPPDDCVGGDAPDGSAPPFMSRVDLRLHPADAGFRFGEPSGQPVVRGWFRLLSDEPVDTVTLLLAVDAFPPTAFNANLPMAWMPTVELTAHVRARPAPGWLRCAFSTRFVSGGFLEEDGVVWDATDHLVAQSRQLALIPRPIED